jgi:hypothetical protein
MLKNISRLEFKINERDYHFLCDMDSPLNDVKEALFQFQNYCMAIEVQVKMKMEADEKAKQEASEVTDPVTQEV